VEDVREGCGSVNVVEILCTHVWKWKGDLLKLFQKRREEEQRRMIVDDQL
jgi:hypothetical protein